MIDIKRSNDDGTRHVMERLFINNIGKLPTRCVPTLAEEKEMFGTSVLLYAQEGTRVIAALNSHPPVAMATALARLPGGAQDAQRLHQTTRLLEHLAVAPSHRGRGYGRALLKAAEAEHRREEVDVWFGFVDVEESSALPFYQACGFASVASAAQLPGAARLLRSATLARQGSWICKSLRPTGTAFFR